MNDDVAALVTALTVAAAQIEAQPAPAAEEPAPQEDDLQSLFDRQKFLTSQLTASRNRVVELEAELRNEREHQLEIQRQFVAIKERVLRVFGIEESKSTTPPAPAPPAASQRKPDNSIVSDVAAPTAPAKLPDGLSAEDVMKQITGATKFVAPITPRTSGRAPQSDSPIR